MISDLAYAEVYFDGNPPPSVLEIPGAKDIAVEFTSMSKTYNMPGWRVGFAAGNPDLIAALARVKSYLDYGAFTPIQVAATAALNGPQDCVEEMRLRYAVAGISSCTGRARPGWDCPLPPATMFVLGTDHRRCSKIWAPSVSPRRCSPRRMSPSHPVSVASASTAKAMCSLGWWRTSHRIRQAVRNIRGFLHRHGVEGDPRAAS